MVSYKSERDSNKKQLDEFLLSRNKTSTHLGQKGETDFAEVCLGAGIEVEHTGKESHKGDYIGIISGEKVLLEVKNYTSVVPRKEVTKFKRDMDENKDCVAGLFFSLKTGISNIKDAFHLEWLHDGRPLLYVCEMENYDSVHLLNIIKRIISIVSHFTSDDDSDGDLWKERVEKGIKSIESNIRKASEVIKNIRLYRRQTSDMFDSLEKMLKLLKDDIGDSLNALSGKLIEDDEADAEAAVAVAETVKTKKPSKKKRSGSSE